MAPNSKYISNSTLGLGPKKVNKVSLPILQRTFSRANATPIQKANVIENNLAKAQLPSKKKSRSTSEPLEESKEIAGIDSQLWESFSANPLYRTPSIQAILPLYQPGSLPALYQPGSLASTSQGGMPFSKPSPDRQVAPGSPGQKENLTKANPGFVDIKDNPGFERQASLMLKPILPTNPSNIPISPPGDSSFRKPDLDRTVLPMDASSPEPTSPAIPQIKEPGTAPLFLSSSETSEKESMIAAQPQVQNLGNAPVPPTQMEPVETGAVIVSFSQAAPIFTDREQPVRQLVDPILTDRDNPSGEKPQVESHAFILAAAAAKKESVLPQSEPLPTIPPEEISKFETGQKSGPLTISQAEHSHALPAQAVQISDRPIQNIVTEKLDLRSAMDSSKQQIPIHAIVEKHKHNVPASLHLPIQPAETQKPLAPSAPPAQPIEFFPLPQETPIDAPLQLDRQTASTAPEPVRFGSALPIQHASPHFIPSYSAAQPRPTATV